MSTEVSKPTPERVIVSALTEEYEALVTRDGKPTPLNISDHGQIIPNLSCVASNLVDTITLLLKDERL